MNILVSACLLGSACRYDGKSAPDTSVIKLKECYNIIPFCPEIFGGLATPRPAAEIINKEIVNRLGINVTAEYTRGAAQALYIAKLFDCKIAILKEKSPSCGHGRIYDGSFSSRLTDGNGITAELLIKNGIHVLGESEICKLEALVKEIYTD